METDGGRLICLRVIYRACMDAAGEFLSFILGAHLVVSSRWSCQSSRVVSWLFWKKDANSSVGDRWRESVWMECWSR